MEFFHGVESTCLPYLTRTAHSASLFESRCVSRLLLSQLRPPATLNLIFIHHCFNKQQSIWNQIKKSFHRSSGKHSPVFRETSLLKMLHRRKTHYKKKIIFNRGIEEQTKALSPIKVKAIDKLSVH